MTDPIEIKFDFSTAQRDAERVRDRLLDLRQRFDLARFEYARQVRIAPTEAPHSHPVITLHTFLRNDIAVLSTYLHEQMHWYATWFSHTHASQWQALFATLRERYPDAPTGWPEGAPDAFSTYLHLLVNWLEIEALSQFIDRERAMRFCGELPFYRWMYARVIADWDQLGALYRAQQVLPIRSATDMSADDLQLAARIDEAPST